MQQIKLYPHQSVTLEQTKGLNQVAYYLDMGLGKTFVGAEKMRELNTKINLLICQKSKVRDWIEHFNNYYCDYIIYDGTKKEYLKRFFDYPFFDEKQILIINYELAWRRPELLTLQKFTLMLDESSLIQNRKAKQTKFILKLKPANVILLSGTPCSGKYENLWTQAHLLGWDISERLYNSQYVNWRKIDVGGVSLKIVDKNNPYKNIERLKSKLREHGAVFMKTEDCFELPDQTFVEVKISTSKSYKKFMENSYLELDDKEIVGDTRLTKRLYARQLCGQYSDNKLKTFEDLINSTNDRLIVFYNFSDEYNVLAEICQKNDKPLSTVNGQIKDLKAYKEDDDSVTLIQYQAGAMGLNLQKANKIIYFTLPERSELYEQSKKRIHRIGQDKPCFYYLMMCKESVEEDIYNALKMREDFTDELFNERK